MKERAVCVEIKVHSEERRRNGLSYIQHSCVPVPTGMYLTISLIYGQLYISEDVGENR